MENATNQTNPADSPRLQQASLKPSKLLSLPSHIWLMILGYLRHPDLQQVQNLQGMPAADALEKMEKEFPHELAARQVRGYDLIASALDSSLQQQLFKTDFPLFWNHAPGLQCASDDPRHLRWGLHEKLPLHVMKTDTDSQPHLNWPVLRDALHQEIRMRCENFNHDTQRTRLDIYRICQEAEFSPENFFDQLCPGAQRNKERLIYILKYPQIFEYLSYHHLPAVIDQIWGAVQHLFDFDFAPIKRVQDYHLPLVPAPEEGHDERSDLEKKTRWDWILLLGVRLGHHTPFLVDALTGFDHGEKLILLDDVLNYQVRSLIHPFLSYVSPETIPFDDLIGNKKEISLIQLLSHPLYRKQVLAYRDMEGNHVLKIAAHQGLAKFFSTLMMDKKALARLKASEESLESMLQSCLTLQKENESVLFRFRASIFFHLWDDGRVGVEKINEHIDMFGTGLLAEAASLGHLERVKYLYAQCHQRLSSQEAYLALSEAVAPQNFEVVNYLLSESHFVSLTTGIRTDPQSADAPPIHLDNCMDLLRLLVSRSGFYALISLLLAQEAVREKILAHDHVVFLEQDGQTTPLWLAVKFRETDVLRALLAVEDNDLRRFMLNTMRSARTPLMEAAMSGMPEMVALLLPHMTGEQIAMQNAEENTALHFGVYGGDKKTVAAFLSVTLPQQIFSAKNTSGSTPCMQACHDNKREIAQLIFDAQFPADYFSHENIQALSDDDYMFCLSHVIYLGDVGKLNKLLRRGDVAQRLKTPDSPHFLLANQQNTPMSLGVDGLVLPGNFTLDVGMTMLDNAVEHGYPRLIRGLLLKKNIRDQIKKQEVFDNPLWLALHYNQASSVEALLATEDRGLRRFMLEKDGYIFGTAVQEQKRSIVSLLFKEYFPDEEYNDENVQLAVNGKMRTQRV
ncbi:MAG: hypothetical protein DHS20C10_09770 [marine bacterium B5-7]|nr:MAG: hypothetical protein DHS20C10_09770 [marine bacterium B5-7]